MTLHLPYFLDGARLTRLHLITLVLTGLSNFLLFIATLTPAWQVAEDTDIHRSIQSGLWIYCPGQAQCWYIFSDDLINYYERVEVCRFLLIADCRKKLLRTPYFFGWHYAVLIMMLIVLTFGAGAMAALLVGFFRPRFRRTSTVLLDVLLGFAFLLCAIALAVFMINGEMLESRYLIGVKNTFPKSYGYSFYLACWGMLLLLFALLSALMLTSTVFFMREADAGSPPVAVYSDYGDFDLAPPASSLKRQQQVQHQKQFGGGSPPAPANYLLEPQYRTENGNIGSSRQHSPNVQPTFQQRSLLQSPFSFEEYSFADQRMQTKKYCYDYAPPSPLPPPPLPASVPFEESTRIP